MMLVSFAERRERAALVVVVAVALAARIGFALTMSNECYFPDSARYLAVADNVLEGRGFVLDDAWSFLPFPDEHPGPYYAASPPGYSAFLAGCRLIAGDSILFVRIAHALMGAAACLVVFHIATALFDRSTAFLAATGCAVYPFFVFFSGLVLSETLSALLFCTFLMLVLALTEESSWVLSGIAGAVAAWATQVRSSFLFLPIVVFPALLWRTKGRKAFAIRYAFLLAWMCFFLMPWTLRNWRILGHPVVTTTRGGMGLYEANAPGADGGPRLGSTPWPEEIGRMGEWERDVYLKAAARRAILSDPVRFLRLALRKAARMWNVVINYEVYRTTFYNLISLLSYLPVMILAVVAAVRERQHARNWCVLLVPAAYFTAIHMIFVGSIRYRLPAMPCLIILAACAIERLISGAPSGEDACASA